MLQKMPQKKFKAQMPKHKDIMSRNEHKKILAYFDTSSSCCNLQLQHYKILL